MDKRNIRRARFRLLPRFPGLSLVPRRADRKE